MTEPITLQDGTVLLYDGTLMWYPPTSDRATRPLERISLAEALAAEVRARTWLQRFICSLIGGPMCPGQEPAQLSAQKVGKAWRRKFRRQYAEEALSILALRGTSVDNDEQWEDIKRRLRALVDDGYLWPPPSEKVRITESPDRELLTIDAIYNLSEDAMVPLTVLQGQHHAAISWTASLGRQGLAEALRKFADYVFPPSS